MAPPRLGYVCALAALGILSSVQLAASQTAVGSYQGFGDARGFLNVLPPGSDGSLNGPEALASLGGTFPPHFQDQLTMYAGIIHASPGLTEERIFEFFKDASFGVREDDVDLSGLCATDGQAAAVPVGGDARLGKAVLVRDLPRGRWPLGCKGPRLFESVYEECLAHEMRKAGLQFRRQVLMPVIDPHAFM